MPANARGRTRLGTHAVDWTLGTVTSGSGSTVTLRAQALAVFKALAATPGELVSKDELMSAVWPNIAVTDDSLVQCITEIRKALGDDKHTIVKTLPKRGYVFEPEIAADPVVPEKKTRMSVIAAPGLAVVAAIAAFLWFPKPAAPPGPVPSIAVLPFDDMSAEKNLAYLGNGVAEDIIIMLSRFPDMTVVARNSSFAYAGKATDIRKAGSELGVDYVLEGSVRKEAETLRIAAQLSDAKTGGYVWAERFDKSGADPWAVQNEVTAKIVGTLTGEYGRIKQAEYRRAWGKDTADFGEYDYYLRGNEYMRGVTKNGFRRAAAIWREGLVKYPDSTLLKIKLAHYYFFNAYKFWSNDFEADYRKSGQLARDVLGHEPLSPQVGRLAHWVMAFVALRERDFGGAAAEADKAIALAPYDANLGYHLSNIFLQSGNPDRALQMVEMAVAANPGLDIYANWKRAWIFCVQGEYEKSLAALSKTPSDFPDTPFLRALNLVRLGRLDAARALVTMALEANPSFTQATWRQGYFYSDPSIAEREIADLAKAGLPEK